VAFDELWPTRRLISLIAIPLSDSRETNVWRHGVASVCDYSVIQLVVQLCELGPDLGLILAGDFLAPPLAVRAGLEADHATPAARAMPVGLRVAALPRVIEVDAVFAPAAPAGHRRERTEWLVTWLQEWLPQ
jgi:hypothetical protein